MPDDEIRIAELLGLLGAFAFILSVLYTYGLSLSLKLPITNYFTMSDYINYAIQRLTPTALYIGIAIGIDLFVRRTEKGLSETEIANLTKNPTKTIRARRRPFIFIFIISLAAAVLNTVLFLFKKIDTTELFRIYKGALPILWFAFAIWYASEPRLTLNWPRKWVLCFYFLPALMISTFINGLYNGSNQLRNIIYSDKIILSNTSEIRSHVLISLEKYLILKEEGQEGIRIIPVSSIESIEMQPAN
jgi:hypothetical protein